MIREKIEDKYEVEKEEIRKEAKKYYVRDQKIKEKIMQRLVIASRLSGQLKHMTKQKEEKLNVLVEKEKSLSNELESSLNFLCSLVYD